MFNSLKEINYKLFIVILLTLIVQPIYGTARIYLIGDIPNVWGYNIASQIAWLNIIYEILQEGVTLPLFFILGAVITSRALFTQYLMSGLKIILPIYSVMALFVWFFSPQLVNFLSQQEQLIPLTVDYIKLEAFAIPLRVLLDIMLIVFIVLSAKKSMYFMLIVQLITRPLVDYIFIGQKALDMGIIGIAYSTITINFILVLLGGVLLFKQLNFSKPQEEIKEGFYKDWIKISLYSGIESAVRNIAFIVMILKLVNEIEQSGVFWVANSFIWGWLLLPILALGQLIKQDVAVNKGVINSRMQGYLVLTLMFTICWILSISGWEIFMVNIMNINEPQQIFNLVLLMIVFYIVFAFNNVFDSYLYGMGRTDLMLYQALFVNCIYYVGAFIAYKVNIFVPSLTSIALLFGVGIVIDFFATLYLFKKAGYTHKRFVTFRRLNS